MKQGVLHSVQAEADMHDEFFGHVIAGIRFGGTLQQFLQAIDIGFQVAGSRHSKEVCCHLSEACNVASAQTVSTSLCCRRFTHMQ